MANSIEKREDPNSNSAQNAVESGQKAIEADQLINQKDVTKQEQDRRESEDAEKWRKQVSEDKIKILYGDGEVDYPHSASWYVSDPSGHEIEVSWADGKPLTFPGYNE